MHTERLRQSRESPRGPELQSVTIGVIRSVCGSDVNKSFWLRSLNAGPIRALLTPSRE